PVRAAAEPRRAALHRPFRACLRAGPRALRERRGAHPPTAERALMVRVLIVDDSATMRSLIATVLARDPEIEVVGEAGDPFEAREAIKKLNPDVITLDVEMPNMNGIDFLEKIMRLRPMPVVMVSTLTVRGAEATMEALELGAIDCVAKPSTGGLEAFQALPFKVKAAAKAKVKPLKPANETVRPAPLEHIPD